MGSLTNIKKGDTVQLHLFTGVISGLKEVVAVSAKTVTVVRNDGVKVKFSVKTGKQVDPKPKNDRFSNFITEDDGSYVPGRTKGVKKNSSKKPVKSRKKAVPEPEEDFDEEDYEEEE